MTLPNVPKDANMPEAVRGWLERVKRAIETALSSIGDIVVPTKASEADAIAGTDDEKFLTSLAGVAAVKAHSPFVKFAIFRDVKAVNTAGGAAASTAYLTRTLNTEVFNNIDGASLSSNEVTLPAGTYLVEASCPAVRVNRHMARLYNVTATAVIDYGTSAFGAVGSGEIVTTRSHINTVFVLGVTSAIRLEHSVSNTTSSTDYGVAADRTGSETYSTLQIWKLD